MTMSEANDGTREPIPKHWWVILVIIVLFSAISSSVTKAFHLFSEDEYEPFIQGADDAHYYMWLRSWIVDGDIDFQNDFEETPFLDEVVKEQALINPKTETGLLPNKFAVGWAVVNMPVFLTAHLLGQMGLWGADGYGPPYQLAVWAWQLMLFGLSALAIVDLLKRWVSRDSAWLAYLLVWLSSPLIYYQVSRISMTHNTVFALSVGLIWLAYRYRDQLKSRQYLMSYALAIGWVAGTLVITRPSGLIYGIFPALVVLSGLFAHRKQLLADRKYGLSIALILAGGLIGVWPQMLAWKVLYGDWIYYSYSGEGFNFLEPQIYMSLLSTHHGLFNWHPLILIGVTALLVYSVLGRFPRAWIVTFVLIIWINASWHMVYFGSAFGGRAYEHVIFFAIAGVALLINGLRENRIWLRAIFYGSLVLALWNVLFLKLFMHGYVSREEPVSWLERFSAAAEYLF